MKDLLAEFEASVLRDRVFRRGEKILVAVSGGVDSMVLLHLLSRLAPANGWKLGVAHLNHGLRGRSSDADEALVRRAARQLGWQVFVERIPKGELKQVPKLSLEMAARQRRHKFWAGAAREFGTRKIALAHHADDQVELLFLRLLRGSGAQGLSGMRPLSPLPGHRNLTLARPMLDLEKRDLESYAAQQRVRFRKDATNNAFEIPRNRIRHELLPLLKRHYQPALGTVITRVMKLLGGDAEVIQGLAEDWSENRGQRGQEPGRVASFDALPIAVRRRVLHDQLLARKVVPDFALVESLVSHSNRVICAKCTESIQGSQRSWGVSRDGSGQVHLSPVGTDVPAQAALSLDLNARSGRVVYGGVEIRWKILKRNRKAMPLRRRRSQETVEFFDADQVGSSLVLRHWLPGDRYQPIGLAGTRKLQDCFTDLKMARELRQKALVAESIHGDIFWVERLRIGERFKITDRTARVLVWRWRTA